MELSDALQDKEALERLPDAALNRLDSLRWEKQRGDGMIECRRQAIVQLNKRFCFRTGFGAWTCVINRRWRGEGSHSSGCIAALLE